MKFGRLNYYKEIIESAKFYTFNPYLELFKVANLSLSETKGVR